MTSVTDVSSFKDRRGGLIFFGILQILIGAFCTLFVPLMLAGVLLTARAAPNEAAGAQMRNIIPALGLYAAAAIFFIWMGIGSIKARRWARAIMLTVSWIWIVCGAVAVVMWFAMMPAMLDQISRNGAGGGGNVGHVVVLVTSIFMGVIYLVLPASFILFYQGRNVRATCEFHDPKTRWTDRCPLPVLALAFMLGYGAFGTATLSFFAVVPFFGSLLTGRAAVILLLVLTVLLVWMVRAVYRMKPVGWWSTLVLFLLVTISTEVTFLKISVIEYYEKMGIDKVQLEMIKNNALFSGHVVVWWILIPAIIFLGFLVFVKKYFKA